MLCDVWCMMCDGRTYFFCKILTLWVKGRPKIPHLGSFRPLSDIPKFTPGGSHIYTLFCRASLFYPKQISNCLLFAMNFLSWGSSKCLSLFPNMFAKHIYNQTKQAIYLTFLQKVNRLIVSRRHPWFQSYVDIKIIF